LFDYAGKEFREKYEHDERYNAENILANKLTLKVYRY
jgi:hypothetical protein